MEIVIDIDYEDYEAIKNMSVIGDITIPYVFNAIRNGTPLPKGHGRLIDADMLEKKVEKHRKMLKISEYDRDLVLHYIDIEMASTIIRADDKSEV